MLLIDPNEVTKNPQNKDCGKKNFICFEVYEDWI